MIKLYIFKKEYKMNAIKIKINIKLNKGKEDQVVEMHWAFFKKN